MIGTGKSPRIALLGRADMRPAMTTRINQRMNRTIHRAGNDNRIRFDMGLEKNHRDWGFHRHDPRPTNDDDKVVPYRV